MNLPAQNVVKLPLFAPSHGVISRVADTKLLIPDPDPTGRVISDPDPDPARGSFRIRIRILSGGSFRIRIQILASDLFGSGSLSKKFL